MLKKRKEIDEFVRLLVQQNVDEFWCYFLVMNKFFNDYFFFDLEMIEYQFSNFFVFYGFYFVFGYVMYE